VVTSQRRAADDPDVEGEEFNIMGLRARVCIGMPVFNGQRYVTQAIESILSQTFTDLELIISDNASTDATQGICQGFAARDKRVHYTRLSRNIGAVLNYERVYRLGAGQYFKWAAHDDVIKPTFLERCVEALDADPTASLAYPRAEFIDADGNFVADYPIKLDTDSDFPHERFAAIAMADHKLTHNLEIFGLMRRSLANMIPQQGGYAASDRVFLARLALHGRFVELPEVLFLSRDHAEQSIKTLPQYLQRNRTWLSRVIGHGQLPPAEWFDPRYTGKLTLPEWRLMWEYIKSPKYSWLNTRERAMCLASVLHRQFVHGNWARMVRDFILAGDKLMARVVRSLQPQPGQQHRLEQANEPTPPPGPLHQIRPHAPKAAA
jgi:glycosyltransferase involved in cell wall biosynthesis